MFFASAFSLGPTADEEDAASSSYSASSPSNSRRAASATRQPLLSGRDVDLESGLGEPLSLPTYTPLGAPSALVQLDEAFSFSTVKSLADPSPAAEEETCVVRELRNNLLALRAGARELRHLVDKHDPEGDPSSGWREFRALLENLYLMERGLVKVRDWHDDRAREARGRRVEEPRARRAAQRRLFLAEISILLILPYVHRLTSSDDRGLAQGTIYQPVHRRAGPLSIERRRAADMNFADIDPTYATKYEGVCLAGLLRGVSYNAAHGVTVNPILWVLYLFFSWLLCLVPARCRRRAAYAPTRRQEGDARILASRFFGASACCDMILDPNNGNPERDIILERAVGYVAPPEEEEAATAGSGARRDHEIYSSLYNRRSAERNLHSFTGWILMANAVVGSGFYRSNPLWGAVCAGAAGAYYILPWNWREVEHAGQLCYTGSRAEISKKLFFARFVWNLPETRAIRLFYTLGLPRICVDHEFYIPPQRPGEPRLEGGTVPVFARVICNFHCKTLPSTTTVKKAMEFEWDLPGQPTVHRPGPPHAREAGDVLLISYHGGGFISMSSFAHSSYARQWAREIPGLVIVSVDYRLAPENRFPVPMNDAYRAYRFFVENAQRVLGFQPRKILLEGDSAGGNLAAAVAVQSIRDNFRVPDGLLLAYPALDMRRNFSPSMLFSLRERIVPFVFLEACMAAYLDPDPREATKMAWDPRCSPVLADDDVLRRMPRTRIVVGDNDPLLDQCLRGASKLNDLGVDVQIKIYQSMPHGFLSFDWPVVGVPEVKACIRDCAEIIRNELLAD